MRVKLSLVMCEQLAMLLWTYIHDNVEWFCFVLAWTFVSFGSYVSCLYFTAIGSNTNVEDAYV